MNRGDQQNGWDTDQFPNNPAEITLVLYYVLRAGGFSTGGINFDAKVRRQSIDAADLFHAHIGAIDILARGLLGAAALIENGRLEGFLQERYAGWNSTFGREMLDGKQSLASISDTTVALDLQPHARSGRQEYLENAVNRALS